jgi:general secretion pathway protein A
MVKTRDPKRRLNLKELGFLEDPFTRSADPRFLYLSNQHGEVLDRTQEVIEERRGLAVVEGGFGVGKSTVARRLEGIYRSQPDDYQIVFVHTASYESEYAALLDVSFAFNLVRRKGMTMQWREFESFLVSEAEKGHNVVIILDDAQMIKPEALDFVHHIYNFDISKKLSQVILFGQPEIQRIYNERPEVLSRVDSWFRLNPLSLEDTFALIRFRCSVAGRKDPLLTQSAFIKIWEATHGIPREIVTVCSRIIDELGQQGKTVADEDVVVPTIEIYQAGLASTPENISKQGLLFK